MTDHLTIALNTAIDYHGIKDIRTLLDQGADPNASFLRACRDKDLMKVFLDAGADPNLHGDGHSALTAVMQSQKAQHCLESFDYLVSKGLRANPDPTDVGGPARFLITDILNAPIGGQVRDRSDQDQLRQALIERWTKAGGDINAPSADGVTALMQQCQNPYAYSDTIETMIRLGADVSGKDHDGNSALHHLSVIDADLGHLPNSRLADLLVRNGADPFAPNANDQLPAHPRCQEIRIERFQAELAREEQRLQSQAASHRAQAFPSMSDADAYVAQKRGQEPAANEPGEAVARPVSRRLV